MHGYFKMIWAQFWDYFALFNVLFPYFSDYTWFRLFRFFIADVLISSQVLGEKHEV